MREEKIPVKQIIVNNNRQHGGEGDIKVIAEDMKKNGLINPITVIGPPEDGSGDRLAWEIVAGRRRVAAAKLLGWETITARVLEGDEIDNAEEIAGSENINRLGMHPLDEATIFEKLLQNGEPIEELAKRFDRKASEIWQRVQLLELDEGIKTFFRNGQLSLQSAAMLKSLEPKAQKEFCKRFKNDWSFKREGYIGDRSVQNFISNLGHDKLFGFLRDKQCADCKTRTYFTDKALFPEMNDVGESCFNHECYLKKWEKVLADRIKSLKGEHKTHSDSLLIVSSSQQFDKITGKKTIIDGAEYEVRSFSYYTDANAKDKGAQPCFKIGISNSGKLEIARGYWKIAEKTSSNTNASSASKKKSLAPVVDILDLPKEEREEALEAMNNSKRISPYGLSSNIRESVFWKVIDLKAQEFADPQGVNHDYKEM